MQFASLPLIGFALALATTPLAAATFTFTTDPFAGTTALTTPGRQVVGGEPSVAFNPAADVFAFDPAIFGISQILFANGVIGSVPTSGVNVVVLQTFDDDADILTQFGAGNAANLLAARITTSGPGFFVYFNQALNTPRLVYSVDLSDPTADLKILARMTGLQGMPDELANFTAVNFALVESPVPLPGGLVLFSSGLAMLGWRYFARSRAQRPETAKTA